MALTYLKHPRLLVRLFLFKTIFLVTVSAPCLAEMSSAETSPAEISTAKIGKAQPGLDQQAESKQTKAHQSQVLSKQSIDTTVAGSSLEIILEAHQKPRQINPLLNFNAYLELLLTASKAKPSSIPPHTYIINRNEYRKEHALSLNPQLHSPPSTSISFDYPDEESAASSIRKEIQLAPAQTRFTIINKIINKIVPWKAQTDTKTASDAKIDTSNEANSLSKLAIIIDDIGNNRALDERAAKLPGAVTLAILPFTPFSKSTAQLGKQYNKQIILHAPMENLTKLRLGEGGLTHAQNKETFQNLLQRSIDSIPHISGLNNHMGSSLTQSHKAMEWVMEIALNNQLYFIDSRTSAESVAIEAANKYKIKHISRDVFLDNEVTQEALQQSFQRAIHIANKNGQAVIIGHPYPETLTFLERELPKLKQQGIETVFAKSLLHTPKEVVD